MGQYTKALEHYKKALIIFKKLDDRANEATALHNFGGVYDQIGQYQEALKYYHQALSIRQ